MKPARSPVRPAATAALVASVLCVGALVPAQAFDGQRRGFLLGLAGGLHTSQGDESGDGFVDFQDSTAGLSLRLMLGGGLTERFTLYAIRDVNLDSDDAAFGLFGLGSHYYFRADGPSAFLHGALGVGDVAFDEGNRRDDDDDYDYDAAYGYGVMVGGGYAFSQGFHVDGSLMLVGVTDDENFARDVDYDYVSVRVMAGYTWF